MKSSYSHEFVDEEDGDKRFLISLTINFRDKLIYLYVIFINYNFFKSWSRHTNGKKLTDTRLISEIHRTRPKRDVDKVERSKKNEDYSMSLVTPPEKYLINTSETIQKKSERSFRFEILCLAATESRDWLNNRRIVK